MKIILALLLIATSANAQYGFQLISRNIGGGGDSFYVWAQKQNSNSYYVADYLSGLTNAVADLQLRSGYTNVNYLNLVQRMRTNEITLTNCMVLASNAFYNSTNGITTNLFVLVAGGTTNKLCFTNGMLRSVQ